MQVASRVYREAVAACQHAGLHQVAAAIFQADGGAVLHRARVQRLAELHVQGREIHQRAGVVSGRRKAADGKSLRLLLLAGRALAGSAGGEGQLATAETGQRHAIQLQPVIAMECQRRLGSHHQGPVLVGAG